MEDKIKSFSFFALPKRVYELEKLLLESDSQVTALQTALQELTERVVALETVEPEA